MDSKVEKKPWHALSIEETSKELNTGDSGLSHEEAGERLKKYGENALTEKKKRSIAAIAFEQVKSVMIIILLIAAVLSYFVGEAADAFIVLAIIILNAILGVTQELKAQKSLEALKKLSAPVAKVIRGGRFEHIEAAKLVPGDIVVLEAGDRVPADLRLTQTASLRIEEAALTGESVPVEKDANVVLATNTPLGDRINMAAASTIVVYGRGQGIIVETGMATQVGRIAQLLQKQEDEQTPLQRKLDKAGKVLGFAALGICAVIFAVGVLYGKEVIHMFMSAIALAVAAIPEGLPAISTIVLALGVQRMVKRNAIIRTLPSVETLGSTTVICSDKTGTLTQNRMTVVRMWTGGELKNAIDAGAAGEEKALEEELIKSAVLCNDTREENGDLQGDPTETALVELGRQKGYNKAALEKELPRVSEVPFDSERKLMTTVHGGGRLLAYTKGAVDMLLRRCTHYLTPTGTEPLNDAYIQKIYAANEAMAADALRVLGFARSELSSLPDRIETIEDNLTFIGLAGMIDPPRPEAIDAVESCKTAGIRTVMITGDHITTAKAIAETMGILNEGDVALTGQQLENMDDAEFSGIVDKVSVYARVSPEHKMRIVDEWKARGEIVAMTGDGVNDAPALKRADIGAAMGIVGTEVAKDAADMVLTDDNFATIVAAVEEGRRISDNILKAIQYLLSCNIGEILVLLLATLFNWGEPLLPIQILWVNLVTDSLPALALGVDPADPGIMLRQPAKSLNIFSRGMIWRIMYQGVMVGGLTLAAFLIGKKDGLVAAQTMAFTTLALSQLVQTFNVRSYYRSAFASGQSNKWLWGAVIASALLMAFVLFVPGINTLFSVAALSARDMAIALGLALSPIVIVEIMKLLKLNGKS